MNLNAYRTALSESVTMARLLWLVVLSLLGWSLWQSGANTPAVHALGDDGTTTRVSVSSDGSQADGESGSSAISRDGTWVAFTSSATNLVTGDTNAKSDLFLHEITTAITTRVTMGYDGSQANDNTVGDPHLSADGRFVAFASGATNLVPNDSTAAVDCYLLDRTAGTTELLSVTSDGQQAGEYACALLDMTPDARYVTFSSGAEYDPDGTPQAEKLFLRDRETGTTTRIPRGEMDANHTESGSISDDGQRIAFSSGSRTLVPDDANYATDVFVFDRATEITTRVSLRTDGAEADRNSFAPQIAGDGHTVIFQSHATNLGPDADFEMDFFAHGLLTGATTLVDVLGDLGDFWLSTSAAISSDARYVVFNFAAGSFQVFVHDRATGVTTLISVAHDGGQTNSNSAIGAAPISDDGQRVVFVSNATNLVVGDTNFANDIFLRQFDGAPPPTWTPTVTATSTPTRYANWLFLPLLSRQRALLTLPRVTNLTGGANGDSSAPVADAGGAWVAFLSEATNLVPDDTNGVTDAFVWHRWSNSYRRVSVAGDGTQADKETLDVRITEDAHYVLLLTEASTLAAGDTNGVADVYRHDVTTGVTEWVSVGLDGAAGDREVTGADISADGRWVVFTSEARNITSTPLPPTCSESWLPCATLYRRDMSTGVTETWFTDATGFALAPLSQPSLSADGQSVAYARSEIIGYEQGCGDPNDQPVYGPFLYYYDGGSNQHDRIAESEYWSCGRPAATTDPHAGDHSTILMYPRLARDVPIAIYDSNYNSNSQYFNETGAAILTYDQNGGVDEREVLYTRFQYDWYGNPLPPGTDTPQDNSAITADGTIAFFTAPDLKYPYFGFVTRPYIMDDRNGKLDIYRYNYAAQTYIRITDAPDGALSNGDSRAPSVAAEGRIVLFDSDATNLVPGDTNGVADIFLWQGE